ncbi:hypothetical protein [Subtercola sp. RTI3]|uniref:hypothetical protein n=1 Tax=Subtercola sp. RTI3 TaxID=3048639 RepID=UPI002B226F41|nr:hypothetical protein [Subtercola sp. RTI3]MEA9987201.1 hypothetical protein [Subtercola sp. RTI3]
MPDLVAAADHIVAQKAQLSSIDDLTRVIGRLTRLRGRGAARDALAQVDGWAESAPESLVRVAMAASGLPRPDVNVPLYTSSGEFVARPDLRFPHHRVCVEYEGDGHRTSQRQWRIDITRTRRLEDHGERVFRMSALNLRNLGRALDDMAGVLRSRSRSRPLRALIAVPEVRGLPPIVAEAVVQSLRATDPARFSR